ncbi:MAG: hypothetical protein EOM50_04640 [Erysipelotrichia bacterium]|nr:hypothetical protein [Erysipelotrichia bacterium]NCC55106.1 hypothetical protein [Erysipelotrichia bacterium]
MKKQAIAFFTMFSLILMLSIYYITLPKETTKVVKEDVSVIADLEQESENNKEEEEEKNNDVISDPDADEESKNEAILKNETLKENEKLANTYKQTISDMGYENSVEIKEKTIYVTLQGEQNEKIASKVMKTLYKACENKYFIEVSFNSK